MIVRRDYDAVRRLDEIGRERREPVVRPTANPSIRPIISPGILLSKGTLR
jgi:hypothetical protein